jgi:hypothetical protein
VSYIDNFLESPAFEVTPTNANFLLSRNAKNLEMVTALRNDLNLYIYNCLELSSLGVPKSNGIFSYSLQMSCTGDRHTINIWFSDLVEHIVKKFCCSIRGN